jgi:hypothetical protein
MICRADRLGSAAQVTRFDPRAVLDCAANSGFDVWPSGSVRRDERRCVGKRQNPGTENWRHHQRRLTVSAPYGGNSKADYRTIGTREQLAALVREMAEQRRISVDTETTSTNPTLGGDRRIQFRLAAGRRLLHPGPVAAGGTGLAARNTSPIN